MGLSFVTGCPSFRAHAPSDGGSDASTPDTATTDVAAEGDGPVDAGDERVADADATVEGGQVISAGPVCSSDRWCWESPLPQGNDLSAVWGVAPDAVWTVGDVGSILYWNGTRWGATPSGTTARLNGVWGTGANDVWAVGDAGTIVRWTGESWATFSSPTTADLHAVWASGPQDAWAVGAQSSILHWTGQWIAQSDSAGIFPANVTMVWGASSDDVWFAGPTGIIRRKGQSFAAVGSFPDVGVHVTAIGGSGSGTVIATGADAAGQNLYVYLWSESDGTWGRIYETAGPPVTALAVSSASAIWAAGSNLILAFNGTAWKSQFTDGIGLDGMWMSSGGDGWAVGMGGQTVRFDGTTWTGPSAPRVSTLTDVWATTPAPASNMDGGATDGDAREAGPADASAPGDGGPSDGGLIDLGGPSLWVSGFNPRAAAHHGGLVWRGQADVWEPVVVGDVAPLWSVWSLDGSRLWAVGETLLQGDVSGVPWTSTGAVAPYRKVRGSFASSTWSVESTVHFSNRTAPWTEDGSQLWGLDVFDDYDVWATADSGRIFHWTSSPTPHWVTQDPATPPHALYAIGGASTNDMWAVGDAGAIRHWTNAQWIDVASGTTQPLRGVWARSSKEVWAVGGAGTVLRWDGASWSPSVSGTERLLYAVTGDAAGNVWAVGEQSTIIHRSP